MSAISSLVLAVGLWSIGLVGLNLYDSLFFRRLGWGGSRRDCYMYLAVQRSDRAELTGFSGTVPPDPVRLFGVFFIDDSLSGASVPYAETLY